MIASLNSRKEIKSFINQAIKKSAIEKVNVWQSDNNIPCKGKVDIICDYKNSLFEEQDKETSIMTKRSIMEGF